MKTIPATMVKQLFLLLLLLLTGCLIFNAVIPYLAGLLGAITLFVLLLGSMKKLESRRWKAGLAAALLMLISFLGILIPFAGVALMLGNKISKGLQNSEKYISTIREKISGLEDRFGFELSSGMDTEKISASLSAGLKGLVGGTANTLIAIGIMYFVLYYMLTRHEEFIRGLTMYSPIVKRHVRAIGNEIVDKVRSNAIGIPVVAIAQGVVALVGFFIFGVEHPVFWAVIVTIGSMVPLLGAIIGIIPVFLISLSHDQIFQAWGILLYGLIIVGTTDNIIRLYVLKKLSDVHPVITLVGVIIGVPIFGVMGLIFGPLLLSLFLILVRIYAKEYGDSTSKSEVVV